MSDGALNYMAARQNEDAVRRILDRATRPRRNAAVGIATAALVVSLYALWTVTSLAAELSVATP